MIKPISKFEDEVSQAAVEFELKRLIQFYSQHMTKEQIVAKMDELREQARNQAMGVRLLIREAWRQKIPVPEEEVEEAIEQVIQDAGGEESFHAILERRNITEELLRDGIRDSRRVDRLIRKITADVVEPTDVEIRAYFEAHRDRYKKQPRRRAQHILVKPESDSPAARQKAVDKLASLKRKYDDGANFAELAAAHSDCPSGQQAGGSMGWVVKGMLAPALDTALFSTDVGEVSGVVETQLGLHILLSNDSDPGGPASFEDSRDAIRELLAHNRRGKAIAEYVEMLKAKRREEDDEAAAPGDESPIAPPED